MDVSLSEFRRAAMHGVAKSRTRLSDWSDLISCIAGGFFTPERPGKAYKHTPTHPHWKASFWTKVLWDEKESRLWQFVLGCKHLLVCGFFDREGSFFFLKAWVKILFVVNALLCTTRKVTFLSSFFLLVMQAARVVCAWEVLLQGFPNPFKMGFLIFTKNSKDIHFLQWIFPFPISSSNPICGKWTDLYSTLKEMQRTITSPNLAY